MPAGNKNRQQNELNFEMPKWQIGSQMPGVRARSCAVATDDNTLYIFGKRISIHSIIIWEKDNLQFHACNILKHD